MLVFSLNTNGLKSAIDKGLKNALKSINPDIICLQEIKCSKKLLELNDYYAYYNYCQKRGYSGTAILTRVKPLSVTYEITNENFDTEGRIITMEFEKNYLVTAYFPNSQNGISRVDYRMQWDEYFMDYLSLLENHKPVIICGDFNIDIDKENTMILNKENNEFVSDEYDEFMNVLDSGFVDIYRYLYPNEKKYTWWQVGKEERNKKIGFRLDYFIISEYLINNVREIKILDNIICSDHCPIILDIEY